MTEERTVEQIALGAVRKSFTKGQVEEMGGRGVRNNTVLSSKLNKPF